MDFVVRQLKSNGQLSVYDTQGYGNELGALLDLDSSYHVFAPEITFRVEDLMELLEHTMDLGGAREKVAAWLAGLESALQPDCIYYVSDAYLWGIDLAVVH